MKILVLGLPGSGKTTQIERIAQQYGLTPIKMGNILREIAGGGGELGDKIKQIMSSGELVEDGVVANLIKDKVEKSGGQFVMEGFPRTTEQIELFDPHFDKVFYLEVPIEIAKSRMHQRGRSDDSVEAINKRLQVQMEDMEKILDYYKNRLVQIDGTKTINEIFSVIEENLK